MTSLEQQWPQGTPERAVADAFSAFRGRDAARLATLSDAPAMSVLDDLIARLPEIFTDSVRCLVVGHVLESRLVDGRPDGTGLFAFECRIAGAGDEWLLVHGDQRIDLDIADPAVEAAYVVFRAAFELPGQGVVPLPTELQIATTRRVGGEWRLNLDEESDIGLPGFRGVGFWIDRKASDLDREPR